MTLPAFDPRILPHPPVHGTHWRECIPEILELIELGYSVRAIATHYHANQALMVHTLRAEYPTQYARAKELRADALVEEIVPSAYDATPQNAHAMRVRIDALKWVASKLLPRVYGDKVDVTLGDPNGNALPPSITLNFVAPTGQLEGIAGQSIDAHIEALPSGERDQIASGAPDPTEPLESSVLESDTLNPVE